jgi:hypothetical protein
VPLYEIRVHYEAEREEDVAGLVGAFEQAICPYPADQEHRCPHRWNIATTELAADEAAELDDLLNE